MDQGQRPDTARAGDRQGVGVFAAADTPHKEPASAADSPAATAEALVPEIRFQDGQPLIDSMLLGRRRSQEDAANLIHQSGLNQGISFSADHDHVGDALHPHHLSAIPRCRLHNLNARIVDSAEFDSIRRVSAVIIQRWWRNVTVLPLLKEWEKHRLTLARAVAMPFHELIEVVQAKRVIVTIVPILALFSKRAAKLDASAEKVRTPSRVFLSAFVLVAYPTEIIPTTGKEEEMANESAKQLLAKFETWVKNQSQTIKHRPLSIFLEVVSSWIVFHKQFEAWKERDRMRMVEDLISHYLDLERLWLSVRKQPDALLNWRPKIDEQEKIIQSRVHTFGASALRKLKRERRQLLQEFGADEESEDEVETMDGFSHFSMARSNDDGTSISSRSLSISSTRSSLLSMELSSTEREESEKMSDSPSPLPIINTELNGPVNSDETDLSAALRSGEFILKDIASSFGLPFSKEQLAHELVLDPEFSLKKPEIPKFEKAVRDSVRKLYFDSVRESFEKEDFSLYIPELVNEIRQKLMAMLPENSSIITELNDRLNPEDIYRSLAARALDVKELLAYIISKMSLLCAPIRDGSIRGISASLEEVPSSPGFVAIVESILELLDDMRLDLANFRLFSLRPVLKNIAAEYERARFASALENGTVHLDRTREWLVRSVTQYGDQGGLAGEGRENRFIAVFHSAITGLVFEWSPPHHDKASKSLSVLPETMAMDVERIDRFRNEGQKLCIVAVLVMLSLNVVPELRGDHAFAVRLKESLVTLLRDTDGLSIENISAELCRQMSVSLERKKRKLEESKQHLVKRMVQKTVAADDPVFDLVRRRIMSVVVAHLATGRFPHDAVERAGLAAVRMELENLSTAVCLWARFNGEVYSRYYDDELREILPVTRVGNSNFAN